MKLNYKLIQEKSIYLIYFGGFCIDSNFIIGNLNFLKVVIKIK